MREIPTMKDDFTEKVNNFLTNIMSQGLYYEPEAQTEINTTHKVSLAKRAKLIHKLPKGKQNKEALLVFSTIYNPYRFGLR